MAQGEFTKQEAKATAEAVSEIYKALPKGKAAQFLGHLNDIYLFLTAAEQVAPNEQGETKTPPTVVGAVLALFLFICASCTTLPQKGTSTIGYFDIGATKVNHTSDYGANPGPAARVGILYKLGDSRADHSYDTGDRNRLVGLVSDISLGYQAENFDAGFDSKLASFGLGLRYYVDTRAREVQPYIGIGVLPQVLQACPDQGHMETAFALGGYAQIGVDFPIGDRSRLGIQYRNTFASNFTLGDQRVNFNGGTLSAELGWGF